jgi:hypothetical protein
MKGNEDEGVKNQEKSQEKKKKGSPVTRSTITRQH